MMKFTMFIIWVILGVASVGFFLWSFMSDKGTSQHMLMAILAIFVSVMTASALTEECPPPVKPQQRHT